MHILLGTGASICLIIFGLIFALTTVGLFAAIAFAIKKIEQQLEKLTNMAEPVIAKATNTLDTVQRITVNVGEKADTILTRAETLTESTAEKVEHTTTVVQEAVTNPLINLSSLITGLGTGLSVWSRAATSSAKGAVNAKNGGQAKRAAPMNTYATDGSTTVTEERVIVTPNGR